MHTEKISFGTFIKSIRENRKITLNELCRGLCSASALSRYENDVRYPEKILANSILERLGISINGIEFISNDKEFQLNKLLNEIDGLVDKSFEYEAMLSSIEKLVPRNNKLYKQTLILKELLKDSTYNMDRIVEGLKITSCSLVVRERMLYTKNELELMILYNYNNYNELMRIYLYTNKMERKALLSEIRLKIMVRLEELNPGFMRNKVEDEIKKNFRLKEFIRFFENSDNKEIRVVSKILNESDFGVINTIEVEYIWENIKNLI